MKKIILTVAAMVIIGMANAQNTTIEKESNKAANQAKSGNVSGAARTASRTWQNHDVSKSSTPGLREAVSKKVEKAQEQKQNQTATKSEGNNSSSNTKKKESN